MKLKFKCFLLVAAFFTSICGEQVALIGSRLASSESNYKTFLLRNDLKPGSNVDVSLSTSSKNFHPSLNNSFEEVDFGLSRDANNELKIISRGKNTCKQQSVKVINSDRPIILLQFLKPFYKTGEKFKFRVFMMNQKMLPFKGNHRTDVEIFDSQGQSIKKFPNIKTSDFGVYEDSVGIPEDSENLGKWKIQVSSAGRIINKRFVVQQANPNELEVYLDLPQMVAHQDKYVYLKIYIKDRFNKFFFGDAQISVSVRFKGSNSIEFEKVVKTVEIVGNKKVVGLDFQDDLEVRFPTDDMILKFDVDVTDTANQRTTTVSREVEMKYNTRSVIQTVRKQYFKPGFKYPLKVKVKTVDGNIDNSLNKLSMSVKYYNEGSKIDKKNFALNLKNGEVSAPLSPISQTTKIVIDMEFAGAKLSKEIWPLPTVGKKEYMQVTVTGKSTTVGEDIKLQAHASEEMETLHVIIISLNGVVHSQEFPEAQDKDIFPFLIKITEEMKPESRGIAFYVRSSDGVIIYDEFTLNLGLGIANSLKISAVENEKPGESIEVNIATSQGSQVFLTATDQVTPQLTAQNEISKTEVYSELTYYLNYKFPNSSLYHFEKFNGFILQPGKDCGPESLQHYTFESQEEDQLPEDIKYFPRILFDESLDAKSDKFQHNAKLLKSFTTWKYYGISVHQTKGFTVAKVQPKTFAKNEIALQVKSPPTASDGEVLWVEISVYNTLKDNIKPTVYLSIENGVIVQRKDSNEYNIKCIKFDRQNKNDTQYTLAVKSEQKSDITKIPIIFKGIGNSLNIKVSAVANNYNDTVQREIVIDNEVDPKRNSDNFDIKVDPRKNTLIIDIKVLNKKFANKELDLDIKLPNGYKYVGYKQNNKVKDTKIVNSELTLFLNGLRLRESLKLELNVVKVYDIDNHRPSAISIHDYSDPGSKHTIHYRIDENSDNCDRIEVTRYTKEVEGADEITKEAERTAEDTLSKVNKAKQNVENAQKDLTNALERTNLAKQNAEKAEEEATKSINITETARNAVEQTLQQDSQNLSEPVQQTNPEQVHENKVPLNAQEARDLASDAQKEADKAQEKLSSAEEDVRSAEDAVKLATDELEKASKDLKDTQSQLTGIKSQSEKIIDNAKIAASKVPTLEAQIKVAEENLQNFNTIIGAAHTNATKMNKEVSEARELVTEAFRRVRVPKISPDIIIAVENAKSRSESARDFVRNQQNPVDNELSKGDVHLSTVKQLTNNVTNLYNWCNSLKKNTLKVIEEANTIKTKIDGEINALNSTRNSLYNANIKLNAAKASQQTLQIALSNAKEKKEFYDNKTREFDDQLRLENDNNKTTATTTEPTKVPTLAASKSSSQSNSDQKETHPGPLQSKTQKPASSPRPDPPQPQVLEEKNADSKFPTQSGQTLTEFPQPQSKSE